MIRAYNDWHIDEWCGSHPGRFIPCALPAIWDPEVMAAEIRRVAKKGCHALTFSENPSKLGWPSIHSEHWNPVWQVCSEESVVVCMHIGSSSQLTITSPNAPMDVMITLQPMNIVQAAADLVWSPVLRKFGDLKVALSEGESAGSRTSWSASITTTTVSAPGLVRISGQSCPARSSMNTC
jgi:predicted TIM-barrel fold metal-dependent hydrolase